MDRVPELPRTELPEVEVTDIRQDRTSISFTVSRPGVPVLVKTSYFPNWVAEGAEGPYRVSPNLMVVVPTSTDVRITYTRTPVDLVASAMSLLGLVGLFLLARRPQVDVEPWVQGRASLWLDDLLSLPELRDGSEPGDGPEPDGPAPGDPDSDGVGSDEVLIIDEDELWVGGEPDDAAGSGGGDDSSGGDSDSSGGDGGGDSGGGGD